ncbi:MAG: GDP-mannose 4,6-dehydratase [Parasphingorhabdus sp.]
MGKRALICGISGQDGAFLAKLLLKMGYSVSGTSRDSETNNFSNLKACDAFDDVALYSMSPTDFRSILTVLDRVEPDEVYNLSGQSSVGLSFQQPIETMESIATATLNLLEAVRFLGNRTRFYNASSSECFGDTLGQVANEDTPFRPRSPYAIAKSTAHFSVTNYREAYGIFACNGILFNHESPLRPSRFVTSKIVREACAIKLGHQTELRLGNLDISRDWGAAEDYVSAMWRMLQEDQPGDYVIASGQAHSLKEFVALVFEYLGMDWTDYVVSDPCLRRPSDIQWTVGDPSKARKKLGWEPKVSFREVIQEMVGSELAKYDNPK